MTPRRQSFPDEVDGPELDKDESVEEHDVDRSTFLILQELLLSEDIDQDLLESFFESFVELDFFPELNIFNSRLYYIHKQTQCINGHKDKCDPIENE